MSFSECGRDTRALLAELKSGLWDQFRAVKRRHDGIAIHYSQPSIQAALLLGKQPDIAAHRSAWLSILEDLGLQFNFVSYEQVEKGALTTGEYRVFILPLSIALSPLEVKAIQEFVARGGTVITDAFCGLMDNLCRRQPQGLLDATFGIRRVEGERKGLEPGMVFDPVLGVTNNSAKTVMAERGLEPVRSVALAKGETEASQLGVFHLRQGKGNAWYLNLDLTQYETERKFGSAAEKALQRIVLTALASAGVKPKFGLQLESGKTPHVEVVRYGNDELEYVGLLREYSDAGSDDTLLLQLPAPRFVYDMRAGRALGRVNSLKVPMAPGECRLYALSTTELGRPHLRVLNPSPKCGERLMYEVMVPSSSRQSPRAVQITLTDPRGRSIREYQRILILQGQPGRGYAPLALNDLPGEWKIEARDVTTGAKVSFPVRVQPLQVHASQP